MWYDKGLKVIAGPPLADEHIDEIADAVIFSGANVLKAGVYDSGRLNMKMLDRLKETGIKSDIPVMADLKNVEDAETVLERVDFIRMGIKEYRALQPSIPKEKYVILDTNGSPESIALNSRRNGNVIVCRDALEMDTSPEYRQEAAESKQLLYADFHGGLEENQDLCYRLAGGGVDGIILDYGKNENGIWSVIKNAQCRYCMSRLI